MTTQESIDLDRLQRRIAEGEIDAAVAELRLIRPADQADLIQQLPDNDERAVLSSLSAAQVSAILEYLVPDGHAALAPLAALPTDILTSVLDRTPSGTAARVLRAFPDERRTEVLNTLRERSPVEVLVAQEEETAGALVTTDFMALRQGMTVDQATRAIRETALLSDVLEGLFVVDQGDKLVGSLSFRDLLLADPQTPLTRVMERDPLSVPAGEDQEECARVMQRYHLETLPIVDDNRKLMGFIDLSDVLEVAEDEATEDMYMIVGLSADESVASPLWTSLRRRLPWLALNLLTAFFAAGVVAFFESTIAKAAILAAFLPIVGGQGGNATVQTVTIIVRSIALGEVTFRNARRVLLKETTLGLFHGLAIGIVAASVAFIWSQNAALSAILGIAMVLNMVAAGAAGVLIPLGLRRFGVDPALAAGIFATTVTDVLGFTFLLGLAAVTIAVLGI